MLVAFSSDCQHLRVWVDTGTACCQQPRFIPSCGFLSSVWDVKNTIDCASGNLIWLNGYCPAAEQQVVEGESS